MNDVVTESTATMRFQTWLLTSCLIPIDCQKQPDPLRDFIPDAAKHNGLLIRRRLSRIVEAPMDRFSTGKYRALLLRAIANGDHVVESVSVKHRYVLRRLSGDIDPDLIHSLDTPWMQSLRVSAGTEDFESAAGHLPQQTLGDLASGGVAGA
jgi:hypothetical protein